MTSAAVRTDRPVITAWSAVSAFGLGRAAHRAGLATGAPAAPVDQAVDQEPAGTAPAGEPGDRLVPGFEVRKVLGKAGTRTMDRSTGLAATAVRELLAEAEADRAPVPAGAGTALVLGTTVGGVQGQHDFIQASFEGEKPYDVPAQFMPSVLMNCAAAASAIRYGFKGPNTTLAGGRPAGLLALGYARRLLAAGRAERALVGAVEEYSPTRAAYERHLRGPQEQPVPLGEGCAVLLMEPADAIGAGRTPLAELLALDSRADVDDDQAGTLAACVEAALTDSGSTPGDVWAAVPGGLGGPAGAAEQALLTRLFGAPAVHRVPVHQLLGDTSGASGAFQLTATLAAAEAAGTAPGTGDEPEEGTAAGRTAVLTSVDRDGTVACAVLRLLGEAR